MENNYSSLIRALERALETRPAVVAAIDGPCASGKTTLAELLRERFGARVIPMDHFFLPPELRTPRRYALPGGNIHHERFLREIVPYFAPEKMGEALIYRPFDCKTMTPGPLRTLPWAPLTLVEGSYSLHKALRDHYDVKILLTVDKAEQERRILQREGAQGLEVFRTRWIPLEDLYFESAGLEDLCDHIF